MDPLVSVIIPVYNVEELLKECIDSLLEQTYKNLEIILIDDGSSDNSGDICDQYGEKHEFIHVIHQKNTGPSLARNRGLDSAEGEYISFIDADDIVHQCFYETLVFNIENQKADICLCDYQEFTETTAILIHKNSQKNIHSFQVEEIKKSQYFESLSFVGYDYQHIKDIIIWNKLYRRELFDNLRFKVGVIHEDDLIIHQIVNRAKKILYIKEAIYYHRIHSASLMGAKVFYYNSLDELAIITAFKERLLLTKEFYPSLYSKMLNAYFSTICIQLFRMKKTMQEQRYEEVKELLRKEIQCYRGDFGMMQSLKYHHILLFPSISNKAFEVNQFRIIKSKNLRTKLKRIHK